MSVMSQCYSIIIDRGISAPGHGKEVVDGLNAVDKRYIYQLMSNVQLPGSVRFDSQIKIHTGTENKDVSLAQELKNHMEEEYRQNGAIDQVKPRKRFMERKWTYREYHVQDNYGVELKDMKIYCNTNQFLSLPFCGPHSKPHGARGTSKHYHLRFDPKLGMGVCAILYIPRACVACTSMLDKPWMSGILSYKKSAINLSPSALIVQYYDPLTIGTLSNFHQSQPHPTHLMKYTMLFLTE